MKVRGVKVNMSASARCECEVTEETEEMTEEKEEGVGAQSQKQDGRRKKIGSGNPTCAIQLKDVDRPTTKAVARAARERRSLIVECMSVRWEGEPRKTESCVRTKCDAT